MFRLIKLSLNPQYDFCHFDGKVDKSSGRKTNAKNEIRQYFYFKRLDLYLYHVYTSFSIEIGGILIMLYGSLADVDFQGKEEVYKTNSSLKDQEEFKVDINGKEYSFKFLQSGDEEAEQGEIMNAWDVNGKLVKYVQSIHLVGQSDYDEYDDILYKDELYELCAYTILDNQIILIDDFWLNPDSATGLQPEDYGAKDYTERTISSMPLNISNVTKLLLFERQASSIDGFDNYYRKSKISKEDLEILKKFIDAKKEMLNKNNNKGNHKISEIEDVISDRRPENVNDVTETIHKQVGNNEIGKDNSEINPEQETR